MPNLRPLAHARIAAAALAAAAIALLLLAAGARAATVVQNGDFETGNLSGWSHFDEDAPDAEGSWYAYSGTEPPLESPFHVHAPPQGDFAATSAQTEPGLHVLYQDVTLTPGVQHTLSLLVYYTSNAELFTPEPETLDWEAPTNQQYRIDVMKPSAPLDSVDPADILATVFATEEGDPEVLEPERITADLTPFGGQTVRLRLAEVDNKGVFYASADDISISPDLPDASPPTPTPAAPSNAFTLGKLKLNRKNGTATVPVTVPGGGTLTAVDAKAGRKTVKKQTLSLKPASASAAAAGTTTLVLKPTGSGRKTLRAKGKLRFSALVTFTPTGGTAASQALEGTLKLMVAKATGR